MKTGYFPLVLWVLASGGFAAPPNPAASPISAREILRDFEAVKNAPYFILEGSQVGEGVPAFAVVCTQNHPPVCT